MILNILWVNYHQIQEPPFALEDVLVFFEKKYVFPTCEFSSEELKEALKFDWEEEFRQEQSDCT